MSRLRTYESDWKLNLPEKSPLRGQELDGLFLSTEPWAREDWQDVRKKLQPAQVANLEPDFVIRAIRSSGFLPQPERRLKRNLKLLRQRLRWENQYDTDTVLQLLDGDLLPLRNMKHEITPARIEQFRSLLLPFKLYGYSASTQIAKFSLREAQWKEASKLFKSAMELKYLFILALESLISKIQAAKCRAKSSDDSLFVTGKYILVVDIEGFGLSQLSYGYKLQIYKMIQMIPKYYPSTVLKTYVLTGYFKRVGMILSPFVPKRVIQKIQVFPTEDGLLQQLLNVDHLDSSQIPVELGGSSEGRYVLEVSQD